MRMPATKRGVPLGTKVRYKIGLTSFLYQLDENGWLLVNYSSGRRKRQSHASGGVEEDLYGRARRQHAAAPASAPEGLRRYPR